MYRNVSFALDIALMGMNRKCIYETCMQRVNNKMRERRRRKKNTKRNNDNDSDSTKTNVQSKHSINHLQILTVLVSRIMDIFLSRTFTVFVRSKRMCSFIYAFQMCNEEIHFRLLQLDRIEMRIIFLFSQRTTSVGEWDNEWILATSNKEKDWTNMYILRCFSAIHIFPQSSLVKTSNIPRSFPKVCGRFIGKFFTLWAEKRKNEN